MKILQVRGKEEEMKSREELENNDETKGKLESQIRKKKKDGE